MKALLATDLDGTLAVAGRINDEDRVAAARLRAAGITILVITGRNHRSLGKVGGVWEVADTVLFSSGSGLIESQGAAPVERRRLTGSEARELAAILDRHGEDFCLLDPVPHTHHFAWKRNRPELSNPDFDSRMAIYGEWGRPWIPGDPAADEGACQALVIRPPGTADNPELRKDLQLWSVFQSSSPLDHQSLWLEVFPAGMDKGSALADWCSEKGLGPEQVMALGNDFNDRSMLEWAGYPRVVGNAPSRLCADYPTLPPAGEGGFAAAAAEALRLFG